MRFERDIGPDAEPLAPAELVVGREYFSLTYADEQMMIPTLETMVYIGRELDSDDGGKLYFQDIDSYTRGVRFDTAVPEDHAIFFISPESDLTAVFAFEQALEELLRCSMRRRKGV